MTPAAPAGDSMAQSSRGSLRHVFEVMSGGDVRIEHAGLTAAIAVEFDRRGNLYVLEMATGNIQRPPFLQPGTGRVLRFSRSGRVQTVVRGLTFPTGMTFGPDGMLYISNKGANQLRQREIVRPLIPSAHYDDYAVQFLAGSSDRVVREPPNRRWPLRPRATER